MRRRGLLHGMGAAAALLAAPPAVRAQRQTTLRFIPNFDLAFLDPLFTPAYITRNHAYLVYDTLYGQDGNFRMSPQMLEGDVVENDGKLWRLTLREGLVWHDGERVLARDCAASIKRWAKRDAFGDALIKATEELDAPDDRTIRFRLKRPFPLLREALGKSASYMCAMMPERFATLDVTQQVTEMVGSGPFRFKADERVSGVRVVYEKFAGYRPRSSGTPDWTAGPKVVHFDRVEWLTSPDPATNAAALQQNERDWWETVPQDLVPLLRRNRNIRTAVLDPTGFCNMMRINHLNPPFDNPEIRRILFRGVDQNAFVAALVGDDAAMGHTPLGFFCPDTPMASEAGLEPLKGPRNYDRVKADLRAAGYAGEKVVLMVPGDNTNLKALGDVAADMMRRCGMEVDYLALDWASMLQRRNRREPVAQGGWSAFVTNWSGVDWINPAGHISIRGTGDGYPGWSRSPRTEELRDAWFDAPDLATQQAICRDIQIQCMQDVPFYPLGQHRIATAYRSSITGVLNGFATFWNVRPA